MNTNHTPIHINISPNQSITTQSSPSPFQRNMNPELQFQKNYPKNVFIPLIEYLAQKGYKQAYQECVGTREQIQRKNVVSLDMIYKLTREPWFQRNINKSQVVVNISNKILMNSKIKKKLFHLLMGQYIFLQDFSTEIKQFKKNISRMASTISSQNLPSDQLFSYPNSIIYLLTLFLKIFRQSLEAKGFQKLNEEFDNLQIQQQPSANPKGKLLGSKEEYKYLVKEIVQLLNKKNISINELTDAFEEIKTTILSRASQIKEQYHLLLQIPNWQLFVELVLTRCFQAKRKDLKITNMILNDWVTQYKNQSISSTTQKLNIDEMIKKEQISQNNSVQNSEKACLKKFSPIILTKNY